MRVTGILTEFDGTLDDMQRFIDTSQFRCHYEGIGHERFNETGQPIPNDFESTLDGAMFSLEKVEIAKTSIESVMSCEGTTPDAAMMEQIHDLETLYEANNAHEQLCVVTEEYKALVCRNAILKECRSLFQSVIVQYSGGSSPIRFRLETGMKRLNLGDNGTTWLFEPLADEDSTIPVSAIGTLQVSLAGVPWSKPPNNFLRPAYQGRPIITRDHYLIIYYDDTILAVFSFYVSTPSV